MTALVYLPLLLPALLALAARTLSATARPELTARALAACAALAASTGAGCLALLALTLLDDLPALEVREHTAGHPLPEPVPGQVAVGAALLLAWSAYRWAAQRRRRRAVTAELHAAGVPNDGLLIADWSEPHAVAVPGGPRRPGHVLATTGLLRLLDRAEWTAVLTHEQAHLRHRHHRTVALAATAAAVNPLLRPVSAAVALLVERSADEDAATVAGDRDLVARAIAKAALGGRAANGWTLAAGGSDVVRRVDALTRPVTGRPWTTVLLAAVIALGSTAATCAALADFIRVALAWLPLS